MRLYLELLSNPYASCQACMLTWVHAVQSVQDPLAIIGILGILFPFLILGVAIGSGYLDLSPYSYPHH